MTPQERISYLVRFLEGGNAKAFAEKCGIPPASLSRVRNGGANPSTYYARILKAYPLVRSEWLLDGEGEPTVDRAEQGILLVQMAALRKEVAGLKKEVEKLVLRLK